jgi:lipopolysaccharide export LptBFGC system permease protein LptF
MLIVNELIAPRCSALAAQVLGRRTANPAQTGAQWLRHLGFVNSGENRKWFIEAYNKDTYEMLRPSVLAVQPDGSRRMVRAERAGRAGDQWVFFEVQETWYTNRADAIGLERRSNTLYLPEFTETPAQIESEVKINSLSSLKAARKVQLSVPEILNYLALHPRLARTDRNYALLYTQLHTRMAAPWTSLVVVLIAIPFGAAGGRRNAYVGVAGSVLICFAFFVVSQFGMALGVGQKVEPWVGAWAANILFGLTGTVLTLRLR